MDLVSLKPALHLPVSLLRDAFAVNIREQSKARHIKSETAWYAFTVNCQEVSKDKLSEHLRLCSSTHMNWRWIYGQSNDLDSRLPDQAYI